MNGVHIPDVVISADPEDDVDPLTQANAKDYTGSVLIPESGRKYVVMRRSSPENRPYLFWAIIHGDVRTNNRCDLSRERNEV